MIVTTALLPHAAIISCLDYYNSLETHPPALHNDCLYFLYSSQSQMISLISPKSSNQGEAGHPGKTSWWKGPFVLLRRWVFILSEMESL